MNEKLEDTPISIANDNERLKLTSKKSIFNYIESQKNDNLLFTVQSTKTEKKYLIETIQNIYSKQKTLSWPLIIFKWFILLITSLIFSMFWFLLFIITPKKERNFCFSMKDNQLDACSIEQVCHDYDNQINIFIFEKGNWDKNDYYNETMYINQKYSQFFIKIASDLYTKNVYSKYQLNTSNQQLRGVVVLSSKELFIIPLRYNTLCEIKDFNIILILITVLGGIIGCIALTICSDIFGRKPIILISLGIAFVCSFALCIYFFILDRLELKYKTNASTYSSFNEILQEYYAQYNIYLLFGKTQFFVFLMGYFIGFALFPLVIILLALLLENNLNDYFSLYSFRLYNFAEAGVAPLVGMITSVIINDLRYAFLFYSLTFITVFVMSFFLLYESMRHLFEYCEWEKLTIVAMKCLPDLKESDFCNENALENHRIMNEGFEKKTEEKLYEDSKIKHSILLKKRKVLLNAIKQNTTYNLNKNDVTKYPYIILFCLIGNPLIFKSIPVLLQLIPEFTFSFRIYQFETASLRFFHLGELYNNIVVNSSIFINLFVIYFSGFAYFCLWRIMTYKRVMIANGLFIILFSLFYDLFSLLTPTPFKDLNRYNYTQLSLYQSEVKMHRYSNYLYVVLFLFNGVQMFQSCLLLKYSKTLFRCTFFGIIKAYQLVALLCVFFLSLAYERLATFSAISILSMLLSVLYVNQAGEEAYLISDVKRTLLVDKKKK